MKILFDHCVPRPFERELSAHHVRTAAQMGWEQLKNGELLTVASAHFDAFLTVDKRIRFQQNLRTLPLAVIVLDATKNTPDVLAPFAPFVDRALSTLRPGQMIEIDAAGNVTEVTPGRVSS